MCFRKGGVMRIPNVLVASAYGPMIVNVRDKFIGQSILQNEYWAKAEIDMLHQLAEAVLADAPALTFLDLGANVGIHSLALAQTFDGRVNVHAVEAQRQIFHMLCGTMALNGLDNVRCYRAAVSDRAGETLTYDLPDFRQANNLGRLELAPPALSDNAELVKAGRERAPTITIDSFAVKVDLIKLDVEGMELRALEGGRQTIARDKPVLFFETVKSDQDAIVGFFRLQGYHGYVRGHELLAIPPERRITIKGLKKVF